MAEDFDVEAMLEAPYNNNVLNGNSTFKLKSDNKKIRSRSKSRERVKDKKRSKSRERKRSRSRSRDRRRSRSRERRLSRSRERKRRSRSRERRSRRSRSRSRDRYRRTRGYDDKYSRKYREDEYSPRRVSPPREEKILEEADQRTVFCMQLAARVRPRDLEEFFSKAGKVREVRLIMDNKTRKHKGIAYIEFRESSSVNLALQLNGRELCGYPIIIQPTQAEKNRSALTINAVVSAPNKKQIVGPMRLYVGSLHFNITEDMLKGIFEPFGTIQKIELMRDPETLRSKGYGFVTFYEPDEAKKALEQLNGFELAGRPMKVNYVTERSSDSSSLPGQTTLDSDELDRTGIDLGTTGRLQLMAKLAEGTGIELPQAAMKALNQFTSAIKTNNSNGLNNVDNTKAISTQCFLLTNMFDSSSEVGDQWPEEIKSDVIEECRNHGGALHVYVDPLSQGNVYIKAASVSTAAKCVTALHGRWFSGRLVTAAYVPIVNYHQLFPDSITATTPL